LIIVIVIIIVINDEVCGMQKQVISQNMSTMTNCAFRNKRNCKI